MFVSKRFEEKAINDSSRNQFCLVRNVGDDIAQVCDFIDRVGQVILQVGTEQIQYSDHRRTHYHSNDPKNY